MSRYNSGFREPPWVMGDPSEVMEWMDATHPSKEEKEEKQPKYLKNLHIRFDLDVPQKPIEPDHFLAKITGKKYVEEDFDIFFITEIILRGLAKAKFKEVTQISREDTTLYKEKDSKKNIRDIIQELKTYKSDISSSKQIEITATIKEYGTATAHISINKIHPSDDHSIQINIKGEILQFVYHTLLNYFHEKIGFLSEESLE